jgi:WS/DGAT/MGAT family acyltransferase
VDGYLWYNETPTNHMHTLKIAVFDPARSDPPDSMDRFAELLDARLHLLPSFRWRLLEVPLGLHHPVWVDDPDFLIHNHVRRTVARAPGGAREMDEAIGRIAGTPLRRDRPLWELHFIEGLAGGRVAAVTKIHHAMADGQAAANQLLNVLDRMGGIEHEQRWAPEPMPTRRQLVWAALREHPRQAGRLPALVRKTREGRRAAAEFWRSSEVRPARPWSGPATFLNTPIDARRTVATTSIPLAAAQALRMGGVFTLNDVVLEIMTAALRGVLASRGELPDGPVVANVPASTGLLVDRLFGNSVGLLFVELPVHVPDPSERMTLIGQQIRAARRANEVAGVELLDEWLEFVPPLVFRSFSRWYARSRLVRRRPPMMNVVASNVRGPAEEATVCGTPISELFSVGPLNIAVGLNITVWSYAGKLNFTVLSCPVQLPDPHVITDALGEAYRGLRAALGIGPDQGG